MPKEALYQTPCTFALEPPYEYTQAMDETAEMIHSAEAENPGFDFPPAEEALGNPENPPVEVVAGRQRQGIVHAMRIKQKGLETLSKERVMSGIIPDSIVVLTEPGEIYDVETADGRIILRGEDEVADFASLQKGNGEKPDLAVNPDAIPMIHQAIAVPAAPWGRRGLMEINFGTINRVGFDQPEPLKSRTYRMRAGILDYFVQNAEGATVSLGQCHSAGKVAGENLLSVLYNHLHITDHGVTLTPETTRSVRLASRWDLGISREYASMIADQVQKIVEAYGGTDVRIDNMGLTFVLPGFRAGQVAEADYIKLEQAIALCVHSLLRSAHQLVYGKDDLDAIIHHVQYGHQLGTATPQWLRSYDNFFQSHAPYDPSLGFSRDTYNKLSFLAAHDGITRPNGWAYGLLLSDKGALGTVTFGTRSIGGVGPTEGAGIKLLRPPDPVPEDEMQKNRSFYQEAVRSAVDTYQLSP